MRTLLSLIVVALLLVMPVVVSAYTEDNPFVTDLIAGNPKNVITDIGEVLVWDDGTYLYVKYVVDDVPYWHLSSTHLAVGTELSDIPQKNDNPIPGQFPYDEASPEYEGDGLYKIEMPDSWGPETNLFIAAHGVACLDLVSSLLLPDQVTEVVINPGLCGYFQTTISGGSILDGTYENGFCIDSNDSFPTISQAPTSYPADVYSSYDPSLPGLSLVENPDNFDLVNWVINQNYVCTGSYTFGEVQVAIWRILESPNPLDTLGLQIADGSDIQPWDPDNVDEIVQAAFDNGEGFIPGCDDLVVIVLVPYQNGQIVQPNIIAYPVECDCDTAWGEGPNFPGKNWAMYFTYTVQDGTPAPPRMSLDSSVTTTWGSIKGR